MISSYNEQLLWTSIINQQAKINCKCSSSTILQIDESITGSPALRSRPHLPCRPIQLRKVGFFSVVRGLRTYTTIIKYQKQDRRKGKRWREPVTEDGQPKIASKPNAQTNQVTSYQSRYLPSHQQILLPGENSIEVDIVTDRDSERERAKECGEDDRLLKK